MHESCIIFLCKNSSTTRETTPYAQLNNKTMWSAFHCNKFNIQLRAIYGTCFLGNYHISLLRPFREFAFGVKCGSFFRIHLNRKTFVKPSSEKDKPAFSSNFNNTFNICIMLWLWGLIVNQDHESLALHARKSFSLFSCFIFIVELIPKVLTLMWKSIRR